jgi:hypothetical protein
VTYEGIRSVRVTGRQETRIPVAGVAALVERVDRIGFFELEDSYSAPVTDHPTTIVTVRSGGRTKRISDYVIGPEGLKALERQIDGVAGTRRWIRIDVTELEALVLKGAAPSRDRLDRWLRDAVVYDELDVAKALLDLGANPNGTSPELRPPLASAMSAAAVRLLIDAGADPLVKMTDGLTLLDFAVKAEVAEALLKAGLPASQSALLGAACDGNLPVVMLLLRGGANPSIEVDGTSPAECARSSKEFWSKASRVGVSFSHEQNFDGVIAALERAAAGRK